MVPAGLSPWHTARTHSFCRVQHVNGRFTTSIYLSKCADTIGAFEKKEDVGG
jgi:hypothetical protein